MKALILVDIQNDFLPGGALAVPEGDEVVPVVNDLQKDFELIVATQDWHPPDHGSFAANHAGHEVGDEIELDGLPQILWPVHCVQETRGAEFPQNLERERWKGVFKKGVDPGIDSYSGFFDNGHRRATGLDAFLKDKDVREVVIAGLATDICVKFTTLDAVEIGFETTVFLPACRGVNLSPGDVDAAEQEMREAGARLMMAR